MKRIHIHIKTRDLDRSIDFYTALFSVEPSRREADYAKWLLDDPAANISLSARSEKEGVDHLGVSLDNDEDLASIAGRLNAAGAHGREEPKAHCCYAKSNKVWARDPQGAVWELFRTYGDEARYGADIDRASAG